MISSPFADFHRQQTNKKLHLRRVTHNSNSTDELVALDPKSTSIRIKMYSRIIKLVDRSIRISPKNYMKLNMLHGLG